MSGYSWTSRYSDKNKLNHIYKLGMVLKIILIIMLPRCSVYDPLHNQIVFQLKFTFTDIFLKNI